MTVSEQEQPRSPGASALPPKGRRFPWGALAVIVVAGILALGAWCAVVGYQSLRDAQHIQAGGNAIRSMAGSGDYSEAVTELEQVQRSAANLNARLQSPPLAWAQSLPGIGATAVAAATLVDATDSVLQAADGLAPGFIDAAAGADLGGASLVLQESADQMQRTVAAAQAAAAQVSAVDPDSVIGPLRAQFSQAQTQLLQAMDGVVQGAALAAVMPDIFGVGEPAKWLVVLSQPSEARGSGGGFYGAYLQLTVSDARFALGPAAANGPETAVRQDLSTLPFDYQRLWGSDAQYLWGFNLSRHYPYTASVIHRALDPSADFVVSLSPRAVAGLLQLSGPVTVDGMTINAANAESFFSRDVYQRYENDWTKKDQVTLEALRQVFAGIEARGAVAPIDVWRALGPAVEASHLEIWSPDPAIEAELEDTSLAGAVPSLPSPWVTAAFNNSAGNKIDSFVRSSLTYTASGSCESGVVNGSVSAELTLQQLPPGLTSYISGRNDEPGAPYGTSSMLVHVYGPSAAVAEGAVKVNGQPVFSEYAMERGHPVWGVKVQLVPDVPAKVTVDFKQPAYPGEQLVVDPQAMVQDTEVTVVDQRSCVPPTR